MNDLQCFKHDLKLQLSIRVEGSTIRLGFSLETNFHVVLAKIGYTDTCLPSKVGLKCMIACNSLLMLGLSEKFQYMFYCNGNGWLLYRIVAQNLLHKEADAVRNSVHKRCLFKKRVLQKDLCTDLRNGAA
jgi:hypothetical protein